MAFVDVKIPYWTLSVFGATGFFGSFATYLFVPHSGLIKYENEFEEYDAPTLVSKAAKLGMFLSIPICLFGLYKHFRS